MASEPVADAIIAAAQRLTAATRQCLEAVDGFRKDVASELVALKYGVANALPHTRARNKRSRSDADMTEEAAAPSPEDAAAADAAAEAAAAAARQFDIDYSVVRRPNVEEHLAPGVNTFAAVVAGMVMCKQNPKFACTYAHCVVHLGRDPQAAWAYAMQNNGKDFQRLYTDPVPVPQVAQPKMVVARGGKGRKRQT